MIRTILARLHQGYRTIKYPAAPPPPLPDRFRGRVRIDSARCPAGCDRCRQACPTAAILMGRPELRNDQPSPAGTAANGAAVAPHLHSKTQVDLGRCLFCTDCERACPHGLVTHEQDYRLAVSRREDLIVGSELASPSGGPLKLAGAMGGRLRSMLGRSLRLRQVSAGGCNACEADTNVLGTVGWDLGRFGIQFVASPRHADGLLVTGPVTRNMKLALEKTYAAVPAPKIVIAVGACAISGGPYAGHPEALGGAAAVLPVDLFVPGCPPHPLTILDGLLRLIGKVSE